MLSNQQTRQTVRTTINATSTLPSTSTHKSIEKKLNVIQTVLHILRTDGPAAFFHGLGPALILVSNPILQFTVSAKHPFVLTFFSVGTRANPFSYSFPSYLSN